VQANTDEMDRANHTDETKWLLPAYVADKPHQHKYSQVSKRLASNLEVMSIKTDIGQ
jgi:hypothetical protein